MTLADPPPGQQWRPVLTEEEIDILTLASEGVSTLGIATQRDISPLAVQRHIARIKTKLRVRSTIHAVGVAYRTGVLPVPGKDPASTGDPAPLPDEPFNQADETR